MKFYYDHVISSACPNPNAELDQQVTSDVVRRFIDPLSLPKSAKILDLACGEGFFLEEMKQRGYTNARGLTLSREDVSACQAKELDVRHGDMNFLPDKDESLDFLFCRQNLEHSPFPFFSLLEFNRVLRPRALMYVEVPAPDCARSFERMRNHYSVMGKQMWADLLTRAGFDSEWYEYQIPLAVPDSEDTIQDIYYVFMCRRQRSADIK